MKANRKRIPFIAAAMAAVACALSIGIIAWSNTTGAVVVDIPDNSSMYVEGELIVGLDTLTADPDKALEAINEAGFGIERILSKGTGNSGPIMLVETNGDLTSGATKLACIPGVSYVQPNYSYSANTAVTDADAALQYYLDATDSGGAGISDAWSEIDAAEKVGVAVLDTGVYTMVSADPADFHQEFDDANLAMSLGRDFVHLSNDAPSPLVNAENPRGDDNGHGTHIAGTIAALSSISSPGHTYGSAGVAPNAVIVPCKVLDASGEGDTASFIMAYDYLMSIANDANIHVVNMSLSITEDEEWNENDLSEDGEDVVDDDSSDGEPSSDAADDQNNTTLLEDKALEAKIEEAASRGIVTICAAGNEGATGETFPGDMDACVCVEALDAQGGNAEFSNYNENKDISAPGEAIYSAWATQADAYRCVSGTSQATAVASGVFAMLWAADQNLSVEQAKAAVYNTAHAVTGENEHIAPDSDGIYSGSHGAIDAAAALAYIKDGMKSISDTTKCKVQTIAEQEYTGNAITPDVNVTYDGEKLVQGRDFTVTYLNNVDWGTETAVALVEGAGSYTGWTAARFSIGVSKEKDSEEEKPDAGGELTTSISLSGASISLAKKSYVYTGKRFKPAVTVKIKVDGTTKTLVRGTDYTVSYKNNVKPGTAKVTIKGKDSYTGSRKISFKIKLGTTKIKKLKAGKRKITVSWQRQKRGTVWYQVRYSTKKTMSGAKMKLIKKNARTTTTLKKLKSGKRYYVQVRTVKKLDGKWKRGTWSAKKSVKVT